MRATLSLLLLPILAAAAAAETIRGSSTTLVALEARTDLAPSINLKPDELAAIGLPQDSRFFRAVVAEVVISDSLRRYADSFAIALYSDLSPAPARGERVFSGRRVLFQALPAATRAFVRIPLSPGSPAVEIGPEPVLTAQPVPAARFPVLLVIQPIMKGIPDSILDRPFFVTFKAEIANRGLVDIRITRPEGFTRDPFKVLLDATAVDPSSGPLEVGVGVHQLEVVSDAFERETAAFAVGPGQTTKLEIALSPVASFLTLDAVAGAVVYLDGDPVVLAPGERRQLTEGIHTIKFKLGETNVSRKIEVRKGHSYHVSLALDLVVKEE